MRLVHLQRLMYRVKQLVNLLQTECYRVGLTTSSDGSLPLHLRSSPIRPILIIGLLVVRPNRLALKRLGYQAAHTHAIRALIDVTQERIAGRRQAVLTQGNQPLHPRAVSHANFISAPRIAFI